VNRSRPRDLTWRDGEFGYAFERWTEFVDDTAAITTLVVDNNGLHAVFKGETAPPT
jgi:hypothetical protein